ncbi:MAG: transketolase [Acidobacteria bacterium]|nr:transketolase [Acidobacteriota bacterium]
MRNAFADELTAMAAEDPRIVLLSGDIGNRLFDTYKRRFPTRFVNCGVAEANMIGVAAGTAMSGLRPIAYTINAFITARCLEQIRVDVCYHKLAVVLVGVGGGLSYASLGGTHHSCEDIAFLRMLPNMTVICPGDPVEVRLAVRAALRHAGPVFLRLGKKGEPVVHEAPPPFTIGRAIVVRPGREVCLLSTGTMLPVAVAAAEALEREGVLAQVVSFHTVKPLDEALLAEVFTRCSVVLTIEEHSVLGGFGGSVAEWVTEQPGLQARLGRVGTTDTFLHEAGEQDHARRRFGLTADAIAHKALGMLEASGARGERGR